LSATEPDWYNRPMRWAQMTFVEDDPGNYDPQFWLDYFRRIHADAACLAAGGYMAFYPTKVPLHNTSRFMKPGMDPFGELYAGCRKLGMNVIARTDPHACRDDVFRAHPDWISVDDNGQKRRHWADSRLWITCTLGPYNWEFMRAVQREIMQLYKVDGIFVNRWEGPGMCYCEHCLRNFRAATGLDLPRTNNPRDKARQAYVEWRQKRFFDLWQLMNQDLKAINPNSTFIPNIGGADKLLDMARIGELAPILFIDRQARRNAPAWFSGRSGKEYRSTLGGKPIGSIVSMGHEEPYRWKDSVQSENEYRVFFADAIANGCRPWFTKFNGKVIDKRWLKPVEDVYAWCWKNERYLRNERPLARVAMVYSQQTLHHYAGDDVRDKYDNHLSGFYQALIESRIPFEMVHDGQLESANIDRFRVLLLPNIAALSDKQCEQLAAYVARGGSLVATFETSLYDEWGAPRRDFGLAKLFGCSFNGQMQRRMQNSYLALEHATKHPILNGLEDTPRIINGVRRVGTKPLDSAYRAPITLIKTYPDLPMEEVYPRPESRTTQPEVYCVEHGRGRVVYFPFDLDRTFFEVMAVDHLTLLRNAVQWTLSEESFLRVTGPGVLDTTVFRQKNSFTIHLVNLTNPMFARGPIRDIFPIGPLTVRFRLPEPHRISSVRLLTADTTPVFSLRNGRVDVEVPSVRIHEVIALDL
jgi:hypothetical protein